MVSYNGGAHLRACVQPLSQMEEVHAHVKMDDFLRRRFNRID